MAGLKLMTQGGYVPRAAPHLLQDNEAQRAINTKLYAGDLRAWRKPGVVGILVPSGTQTIYKGISTLNTPQWLGWQSEVDVVRNVITDSSNPMSIYYTGDGTPKKTNSTLAGNAVGEPPDDFLNMGVQAPAAAPTVARVGSGGSPETRIYVYTNIQEFGGIEEESAPSPASAEVLCGTGDTITVSGFSAAPTGDYNVTKRRIYRSVTGSATTTFLFVAEIPVSTTSYSDNALAAALGEELRSLEWSEPPTDLAGLVAHPNGFLVGFAGQDLYFSEPLAPHAWPIAYRLSLNVNIVGLGVYGSSIAVMTEGYPVVVNGLTPESMSPERLSELEPCVSKKSIVSDTNGVMYASPNGICVIGPGSAGLSTGNIMLRDNFQKFNPSTIKGAVFAGKYFGFYSGGTEVVKNGGFILDRTIPASPLSLINTIATASFVDPVTAEFYVVEDSLIKLWEGDKYNWYPYDWLSKRFIQTRPINFGALEIDADFNNPEETEELLERIQQIIDANEAIFNSGADLKADLNKVPLNVFTLNGSILQELPNQVDDRYMLVEVYCDGQKVHSKQYTASGVYRMPSGYKGQAFEIRLSGNVECRYVKMAETVKELATL